MSRHVIVVGGGVIGLATAYYLRRCGADVTLLERGALGSGASWGNSGWVAPSFAAPLPGPGMTSTALRALRRRDGSFYVSPLYLPRLTPWLWRFWRSSSAAQHEAGMYATASLALSSQRLYDDLAADGVRFESRRGGVVHAFMHGQSADVARRQLLPLTELGYGIPDSVVDGNELRQIEPALGSTVAAGFIVEGERTVFPPSLLAGLRARLVEMGATVRESHAVRGFVKGESIITAVQTRQETIAVDDVVLAAGVWSRQLAARLGVRLPLEAGKGYSFTVTPDVMPSHSLHLSEANVAASPFADGLRLAGTMELSGMRHQIDRRRVAAVARSSAPYLKGWVPGSVRHEWVGMRPMTCDGLPVLGRPRRWRNLYLATGHGMSGVMLAPATGQALARLIVRGTGSDNLRAFSPDRFG